ncbi:MAG: YetF domain-containing protein [Flavipsychrobacter sp.]
MKAQDIHWNDWARIFNGDNPSSFLWESVLRLIVIYLILIISMRFLGKRIATQLSRLELAALVSLAAAIGVPVLASDRGLLPAIIIAVVVVVINRLIPTTSIKSQRFEKISQGNIDVLVRDGVMQTKTMLKTRVSRERLMAQLRHMELKSLGKVKRLYLEAGGNFTVIKEDEAKPGLSLIPGWHTAFAQRQKKSDAYVCCNCGNKKTQHAEMVENCKNCGERNWVQAIIE